MTGQQERIADYLAQALEVIDRGETLNLAALCADDPELAPAVAAALGLRDDLPELHDRAQAAADLQGRTLAGRYRLEQAIGQGAAGAVFRAHDLKLSRDVAIKLLHHGLFASPEIEARFRREAEVLAQHEHPHIVRIYDQGSDADGSSFLVTELLRGVSLQQVLEASREAFTDGPSSAAFRRVDWLRELLPSAELEASYLRQIVVWIRQLAGGLVLAHDRGVFHRDIKPSNAFIREDGTAVLLDFGIAIREGDAAVTLPNVIVGTPCYMAPEQAEGRPEPRPSIDVYGLTATLYHLITLVPPHDGDLQAVLTAVRTDDPTPASWLHGGLPRDLQAILDCGLEHDLGRRYGDVTALLEDIDNFLQHRPVSARPINAAQRFVRSCRRRPARAAAWLLGAALVAAMAVIAPLWAAAELHAANQERSDIMAQLPGDVAVEGWADMRALVPIAEREVVLGELDRLVDLDPTDPYARVLRAAERLDAGDASGAAADFERLGRQTASSFMREVAARYRAVAERLGVDGPRSKGHNAIDLSGLPEPTETADFFVAGFHALRGWEFDRAEELLSRCVEFIPARDLRLLASLGKQRPAPDSLLAEAGWLEGHYGRKTARTRHAMAAAMLMLRNYDKAIEYCRESLALRPDRHGPWNNLGLALLRTGQLAEAKTALEKAVSIREWFPNSLGNLAQVYRGLGDFEGAEHTANRIEDASYREHELGNLAVTRALVASAARDDDARIEFARAARAHFEAAAKAPAEQTRNPYRRAIPSSIAYADALAYPDRKIAVIAFLQRLRRTPANPQHIANVARQLRDLSIDDLLRDELRLFLFEIASTLAPGDTVITHDRDELRATQKERYR